LTNSLQNDLLPHFGDLRFEGKFNLSWGKNKINEAMHVKKLRSIVLMVFATISSAPSFARHMP